ncbi:hypothetical protein MJI46_34280, partial [Salmonella enterica subsp. enterica serovar Cerro]|nr:hypothetical protein [Salmonella enterica subsp. enterica serovar Cerro]
RYRVLKNIMGLWLLQRVLKERRITDLPALIAQTEALPACRFLEGAGANELPDQVPEEVKEERWNRFMQLQQQISAERLQEKVGR